MVWQYHPLLILFALGGLVSLVVAGYCWRYMQIYGRSYLVASVGLLGFNNAIWVFAATFKTASTDLQTSLIFYKLEFLGVIPNTAIAIVVALAYVGRDRWLTRRTITLLGLVPVAFISLILANPGNVMIVDPTLIPAQGIMAFEHEFPPLFVVYLAWVVGTVLFAVAILAWGAITDRVPTLPSLVAILALLFPYVAAIAKIVGIYPPGGDGINITPAMSAIGISVLAVAIIRYRVFDLIPVGRDHAIEVMVDGYLLVNSDGTILDANPAAADLLGWESGMELRNRSVAEVLPVYDDLTETTSVDFERGDRVLEIRRSDVTRQNQNAGHVFFVQDVTEKRRHKRELERRNERLDKFASRVSHDLQNPLHVAEGKLALAQAEVDSEHLAAVGTAHERMEALIDDLLGLARHGDTIKEIEQVDLASLAEATWRNVATAEATLVTKTEQTIMADLTRVQQLLENLFGNAVEHGGEDVTVTVGEVEDGFFVADDGSGIPADERESVFEAGYSTRNGGTGFGLNIVKEISDAHGWEIQVAESTEGGARFEIIGVEFADG